MYQYSNSLIRQFSSAVTGNAAVGVQATVYVGETGTLASLFEVNGSPKSNPVTTDGKGFYSFSLADGDYRIVFSSSQFATLRISVLDGAQIREDFDDLVASNTAFRIAQQAAYDSFVLSQGWDQVGTFAAGFTFTSPNQVGQDSSGSWWRWNGAFPKVVTAGTLPSSDANYKLVGDGVLRSDLNAGTVPIKHLDGTAALPSIAFGSDPDTGFFLKAANIIALAVAGIERWIVTAAGRMGVGTQNPTARLHAVVVNNDETCGIRSTCSWSGTTAAPYQNNDCTLFEVFNDVQSNSLNQSWAVSAANAYNNIPAGVADTGFRVGVYGWAVSTPSTGYSHAGTLEFQFGTWGRAGFLNAGTPSTAVINNAIGARGDVINDSTGCTIVNAVGVEAGVNASAGNITNAYGVRTSALNALNNWSFYGDAGRLFNQDQCLSGSTFSEFNSKYCARGVGNSYEFGFPTPGGYGSGLGSMRSSGKPFVAFCCENESGDTFTTTGEVGHVIADNLDGGVSFARATNPNAENQTLEQDALWDENGRFNFLKTPIIPAFAPASATAAGQTGQISWGPDYIYVCIGTNVWRRAALTSW